MSYPNSKAWGLWMDLIKTYAPGTRSQYLREFQRFLDYYEIQDPENLYKMRLENMNLRCAE